MNKFTSRKLILTILFTALFTILLIKKTIAEGVYSDLMTIMLLSYFGANAAIKLKK